MTKSIAALNMKLVFDPFAYAARPNSNLMLRLEKKWPIKVFKQWECKELVHAQSVAAILASGLLFPLFSEKVGLNSQRDL